MTTAAKDAAGAHRLRLVDPQTGSRSWIRGLIAGPGTQSWARTGLLLLLTTTAVLYLWNLTNSGWANEYYAAAAQAGTQSWKALLFGSFDAGNAITVDKPPAAIWVMGLSGRLLGFGQWAVLLPQALMGVGSVALLYATVRRLSGPGAGLLAGTVLALTPVATVIFRFDNPDALLVLTLVAAAYCTVRAIESTGTGRLSAHTGWLALAGAAVGLGFLTKMMQAFVVLPGLGLAYLIAASGGIWKRIGRLAIASAAVVVSAGWYVALVELWPADSRPFIGGSDDNSLWQLAVDYNGLGRLFGGSGGSSSATAMAGGSGGHMAGFSGPSGLTRLFGEQMGAEISWLLPAALIGLVAGLWLTRRAPRTDRTRAALILWGGWLLVTGALLSYMSGMVHPYYTVALAPAIGALVAISVRELWLRRTHLGARLTLASMSVVTGVWSFALLDRTPDWQLWLRWTVVVGAVVVALALVAGIRRTGRATAVIAALAVVSGILGTGAYAAATAAQGHSGGNPLSGPTSQVINGPFSGGKPSGGIPSGGMPSGGMPGDNPGTADLPSMGAASNSADPSKNTALLDLLKGSHARWSAAAVGSFTAAPIALSSGTSVMSIGGFGGADNSPTLAQFQQYVANGEIGYFVAGMEGTSLNTAQSAATQITSWVKANFTPTEVGGTTVYDLSHRSGS
ncbi:glycosyltransferase family 39 protein [Nocardia amamiensis]|uniref:glycosyltransferase family 39 protein n=1 Tax=Nocardia TaxID=1817 RepID=UPI00340CCA69